MTKGIGTRREQILKLLLESRLGLGIDEIAEQLDISRNAVQQHLSSLEQEQLIKKDIFKSTGGRPSRNYVLTERGINYFPKQYSWFGNLVLSELKSEMSEEAFRQFMWRLGVKLANTLAAQFSDKKLEEKIVALINTMQSLGYHASLDTNTGQPVIKASNCVYHDLAQQFSDLCDFDHALISTLLDRPIEQTACMARGDCSCKFLIKSETSG
ncbi:HTH domain-containing protein [Methylotuvimicrobium sp. KM2]|uniref:helix-turn-helix transcriptional regulator n=1 Tax=Methylotuvimicrobium sp. KM2 TaxID=3133976 RepID=UPI00310191F2